MHKSIDPAQLLTPALEIAIQAGRRILEFYEKGFEVEHKEDLTPLTEADVAAHKIIEQGLRELTPELPVITEESANIPFSERQQWQRYWLVDPLDGTREFINGNGEFCVNIALVDNHVPVLGVIYAPVLGVYYYAAKGQGAYKREATNTPEAIHCVCTLQSKPRIVAGYSPKNKQMQTFLERLGEHEFSSVGAAIKTCMIAEGEADLYIRFGPTSEWDTAAAQCILEEAGGIITDTDLQPLRYNTKDSLLNPHFIASACGIDWSVYL